MASHELYLVRHGLAAERGPAFESDGERPLTPEGISRMEQEAAALGELEVGFDVILTSPLVRARQTADALAAQLRPKPPVIEVEALAPGSRATAVARELAAHRKASRIALVGHEPDIGELAARLIGARQPVPFKKGAICCIEVDTLPPKGPGVLRWFATPRMLRRMG
jgi:phosphohistidine phosphatase